MTDFDMLLQCPFCPGIFRHISETPITGPLYHLCGIIFCPHCHTRIVGQRGERPGLELRVIPTSEEMAAWFETGRIPDVEDISLSIVEYDHVSAELERMKRMFDEIFKGIAHGQR